MIVPIVIGSEKDRHHARKIAAVLDELGIPHKEHVASAHKVPEKVLELIRKYDAGKGPLCYITAAGRSNALSGFVAANTLNPCIACPPFADKEDYLMNIHSTLLMPSEVPSLTVIDPTNAALAAARILGVKETSVRKLMEKRMRKVKQAFK
jgi:5-(carboxyamino)imidazole ribonucleotide mutase